VVKITHRKQIYDLAAKESDEPVGHPKWLSHYPDALTAVVTGLTEAELADTEKLAKEWSDKGAPREVQRV
jgi:hypothetical protein